MGVSVRSVALFGAVLLSACGPDPADRYRVSVSAADVAADHNGMPWDPDGSAPDVAWRVECPDATAEGPAVESYAPTWSGDTACTATVAQLETGLPVELRDVDATTDDPVWAGTLKFSGADAAAGTADFTSLGATSRITVRLQRE